MSHLPGHLHRTSNVGPWQFALCRPFVPFRSPGKQRFPKERGCFIFPSSPRFFRSSFTLFTSAEAIAVAGVGCFYSCHFLGCHSGSPFVRDISLQVKLFQKEGNLSKKKGGLSFLLNFKGRTRALRHGSRKCFRCRCPQVLTVQTRPTTS